MEVQGSLGRQIQGISQQPPAVRLQGQCTDMVNMVPDVVDGTKSRMGTVHIARLMDAATDDMALHHYRRGDDNEEYFFFLKKGAVPEIYDKAGNRCPLSSRDAPMTYLSEVQNPREDVQFMTIADVTFMLNRRKVVKARQDKAPEVGSTAIVFCAYGQYGTNYSISLDGTTVASFKTPDGSSAEQVEQIRTGVIASNLYASIQQHALITGGTYSVQLEDTCIYITRNDGSKDFTVSTTDGAKGKDLVAIKYKVSSTDLLPSHAPAGYKVQVWPTGSKPESRYWLQAEPKEGNLVTWKETVAAGAQLGFDKSTMPYIIERTSIVNGIAQFTIRQGDWEDRKVGDDLTNPMPSFIDDEVPQTIGGMFMVQNRFCVTAGEAVIMTRTSRFFDFFRYTVLSSLDTDPIDIFSDASEVYQLKHAITLDGDTVLFSDNSQFILPGDKALTKDNALLRPTTAFEVNNHVRPVATGESVMFATSEGAYSGVREFYTDSYTDTKKAQPITSHVNRLLEGNIISMIASSNINRLIVLTDKNRNVAYVYDWLWQGTERVQAAWHKWVWPSDARLCGMFYSSETLYVIIERGTYGVFLEKMDMGDALEYHLDDRIRLDRRALISFEYDPASDGWYSSRLPWEVNHPELLECVITKGWPAYTGGSFLFQHEDEGNRLYTTFDLGEENSIVHCVVGELYSQEFEPTPVIIKDSQERTSYIDVPTVGLVHLNMDKYPDFTVEVTNTQSGKTRTVKVANRRGGALSNRVGYVKPFEGVVRFPLRAKSTDVTYRLKSTAPHTLQLRDIEWEGTYNPSKRRV